MAEKRKVMSAVHLTPKRDEMPEILGDTGWGVWGFIHPGGPA